MSDPGIKYEHLELAPLTAREMAPEFIEALRAAAEPFQDSAMQLASLLQLRYAVKRAVHDFLPICDANGRLITGVDAKWLEGGVAHIFPTYGDPECLL